MNEGKRLKAVKVVHLTTTLYRYDQRMLWREAVSLQENGFDVTLVVNDAQGNETLTNGIKIVSTGFVPANRFQRMTEGVERVYNLGLAQNADIYQLHETELLTVALKLKRQGKKVIFDSHEFYGEVIKGREWIPSVLRRPISCAYTFYETYVCKRIDGVIVVGTYDGEEWFYGRAKRVACVPNYPRWREFENIEVLPYTSRENVCYSGGISKEAGSLVLLQAVNYARRRLILAGRFQDDAFHQQFMKNDIHGVVNYLGFLNRKELFEMYAKCAIGICTFLDTGGQNVKTDNFNTKVYEYMAMEMPVILSDWPYKRKMVEKYQFGLVADPSDAQDISSKITWLFEHPKEAEEMGKNGKRLLEEQFVWERAAEPELLRMYREVEQG